MANPASLAAIQKSVWGGRIPLEISLAPSESRTYDKTDRYLVGSNRPFSDHGIDNVRSLFPGLPISPRCSQSFELFSHHL